MHDFEPDSITTTIYGILELNSMSAPTWLQFTGQQPKRKRAELACIICHGKKVREISKYIHTSDPWQPN